MQNRTSIDPKGVTQVRVSRRRLIKVAVATAPIIATLPSGAALARSSNVIGAASAAAARDSRGRTLCLDGKSGAGLVTDGADLGQPPHGSVVAIKERNYRVDDHYSADSASESDMCKKGGDYYYRSSYSWKKVSVPKGILVSATALASFAGQVSVTEI